MVAKASYAALNWETQHTELHLIRFCRNFGAIPSVFNGADFHVGARIWSSSAGQDALPGHDTKPMISLDRLVCRAYGGKTLKRRSVKITARNQHAGNTSDLGAA